MRINTTLIPDIQKEEDNITVDIMTYITSFVLTSKGLFMANLYK